MVSWATQFLRLPRLGLRLWETPDFHAFAKEEEEEGEEGGGGGGGGDFSSIFYYQGYLCLHQAAIMYL